MVGKIALLGWGSLLWDGGDEFGASHEPWREDGPTLRIEFSRISKSRGGALTLVIDPEHGQPVKVAWTLSRRLTIDEAVEDLRDRERTTAKNIGRLCVGTEGVCKDRQSLETIRSWATERGLSGVVWTDLRSNFEKELRQPFSVDAAINYMKGLSGESRAAAMEYFRRAPSFMRTPLREAVDREFAATEPSKP